MKDDFKKILNEFSIILTKYQQNQYMTKLRDYLVPYIEGKYGDRTLEDIFKYEFTRNDLIEATIYYIINNENVKRKSAVDDYLIAMNSLFSKIILPNYNNQNLLVLAPFSQLSEDVTFRLDKLNIKLLERESHPAINEEQVSYIIEYLDKMNKNTFMKYQYSIVLRLYLLYGFSTDKMAEFKVLDYEPVMNILRVENISDQRSHIYVELPYSMRDEFSKYLKLRKENLDFNSKYLFITGENNQISSNLPYSILSKIRKGFERESDVELERNPFTGTGLQKYAIIKMILIGMNESIISEFTGQKSEIMYDCQLQANQDQVVNRNRYINHMVRGVDTYDFI